MAKNACVFQNVFTNDAATSATMSTEMRFCDSGASRARKYQRSGSAPMVSKTS